MQGKNNMSNPSRTIVTQKNGRPFQFSAVDYLLWIGFFAGIGFIHLWPCDMRETAFHSGLLAVICIVLSMMKLTPPTRLLSSVFALIFLVNCVLDYERHNNIRDSIMNLMNERLDNKGFLPSIPVPSPPNGVSVR